MATYSVNNDTTTFNLPDEGTTFRASGDTNGDAVYKVVNGQLQTVYSPSYIANTSFRDPTTGTTYNAGDVSTNPHDVQWLDPNYRGTATSRLSAYEAYKKATGLDANALAQYNLADIQTTLNQNGGRLPTGDSGATYDPAISGYVNPNAGFQNTGSTAGFTNTVQQPTQTYPAQQANQGALPPTTDPSGIAPGTPPIGPNQPTTQQSALSMPANGSVVDLLSMAGQDSSFAARQQLATQFGIQNYSGTAQQNTDLAKKYLDAYNANKGTAAPQNGADARSQLQNQFSQTPQTQGSPSQQFMDAFAGMDPVQASIYQQLSSLLSTPQNKQSLTDFYKQEIAAQGIPELNMELADINRIMEGTEDDIREEVTKAGGFATESQVQALTSARNKTLLKKATYLADVINAKNDYVDRIVSLTQADRKQVSEDLDRKLGISKTLFDMSSQMQNAAKENYKMVLDSVGWAGLAQSLQGNPTQQAKVEKLFGLGAGQLQALASYKKPLTETQQLELENQKLQNQKLRQSLEAIPAASRTPEQNTLGLSMQQSSIADINSLSRDPGLGSAVGPNPLARYNPIDMFTGAKSNFIASVEQLRQQLTLDKLVQAKQSGATFGALSDGERQTLAAAATKIGTWAIRDAAGNITGYNTSETEFKKELDKINYFQQLDYVLKGGVPSSVGIKQMGDGTLWVQNSDGTFAQLI